jgi:hypothetical protein
MLARLVATRLSKTAKNFQREGRARFQLMKALAPEVRLFGLQST